MDYTSGQPKRKRIVTSIQTKLDIISRLEKEETITSLAQFYKLGKATISDIKKKKEEILNFASKLDSEDGPKSRKTMRTASDDKLDEAVYLWFLQRRAFGDPISGPLLCEKALDFNEKLGGSTTFSASTGWLKNFKSRHGIRELNIEGEKMSADTASAASFKTKFQTMIQDEGYKAENVYNADETGINWRALPRKSLASARENAAPGYKVSKERITAMVCANSTGSHALKLLVISKSKNPRCFKNTLALPVSYRAQKNSWMDSNIFIDWYQHEFIPEVKRHQDQVEKKGKVLLLIDNAPSL